jgi:RES domain-containing protein
MLAWRLCRRRYADLDGFGAARAGGRWNPVGIRMVYMSSTDALAVLEVRVHLQQFSPATFVFVTAEIPDELIERLEDRTSFESGWQGDLAWSREIGRRFIKEARSVALSVPSVIVEDSRNVLLNPLHPDFQQITAHSPQSFVWDLRLWG